MEASITTFDQLGTIFETTPQRLVVTVVVSLVFAYGLRVGKRALTRLDDYVRPVYRDLVGTVVFLLGAGLAGGILIGTWQSTQQFVTLVKSFDLGTDTIAQLIVSVVLIMTAVIGTRFLRRLIRNILGSASSVSEHQKEVTYRLTQVIIYSLAGITVLGIWVEDLGAILVGAGFLGIVLGMAAQQTLGALLAGFVLMFSRPFEIGDWVVVDERHDGVVTDISIFDTRLRTVDGEYIVLPNDVVGSAAVTNRSHAGRLRLEVEVGVDYGSDVERAAELAREITESVDIVLDAPRPRVATKELGDSSVVLGVRFWIDRPRARRAMEAQTGVTNAIKAGFDDAGIKIPFPQRELSGAVEPPAGGGAVDDEAMVGYDEPAGDADQQSTATEEADPATSDDAGDR
ncbi:small-conductance mechanosensitive channel [Halovivax ruber XH-70]|uniref:Small-conductance mechanosensitive channel n=1 Tax=Halovivax ruber (strain DSM 18193 / JCM 13892 / XH-70) TaxID=797302 RepID=L0IDE8_HALRX|nr:mechanosensitive ion channel family protein [Halovivax ruber]AGB15992.1 small-conductance mechanosensitive channel [Halovivax ruber XH-70]